MRWFRSAAAVVAVAAVALLLAPVRPAAAATAPAAPGTIVEPLGTGAASIIRSDFVSNGHRNFEVAALQGNTLVHYWKDNGDTNWAWHRGQVISTAATGPGAIVQSDFMSGGHGNLEVFVQEGDHIQHYWHDSGQPNSRWQRGGNFGSGVTGPPSVITSDFVSNGHRNFEVVVPEGNNLVHYWHDNGNASNPWQRAKVVTTTASGPGSLIQTTFMSGGHGNLELVVREGDHLVHYWHDSGAPDSAWQRATSFGSGITGAPSFIQSSFGSGNFEVVAPAGSELVHFWKDNSNTANPWAVAGEPRITGINSAASLIQTDFGSPGNLELVVLGPRAPVPDGAQVSGNATDYRLIHYWHDSSNPGAAWGQAQDIAYRGRSEKVCQQSGKWDLERLAPTVNGTSGLNYSEWATDLGYPVDDGTTLSLMFGDTHLNHTPISTDEKNSPDDVVLQTRQTTAPTDTNCLQLTPVPEGNTVTPAIVTVNGSRDTNFLQGFFNVPTSGFAAGGSTYAAFWTKHCMTATICNYGTNQVGEGWMTRRNADGTTYERLFRLPPAFVYTASVNSDTIAGLPADQRKGAYVYGVPNYRASYPYLAYVPAGSVADQSSWRYFTGLDAGGSPLWSADPAQASNVFNTGDQRPCIGEFSVSWIAPLQKWLMLYNCDPGVVARFSDTPWGPWSAPSTIFSPGADNGLCHFIHDGSRDCDNTHEPGATNGGGPYAPFILSRYTSGNSTSATIYYLLSTWNPYQVVVMRATLHA
ncbi:DUF4185 domain-containing protein [Fodinicola acaciae]|uniref:DUF4185 domain-containing protein n=1 Tax=Fodinicola acaciae TaxID=2681555 RepID=UPI0013D54748|nr:DUF4185 domain-containing protein [Fodinicola acaciae]